eukprot:RCo021116
MKSSMYIAYTCTPIICVSQCNHVYWRVYAALFLPPPPAPFSFLAPGSVSYPHIQPSTALIKPFTCFVLACMRSVGVITISTLSNGHSFAELGLVEGLQILEG